MSWRLVVPGKPVPWAPKQMNRKTGSRFEPGRQAEAKGNIMAAWKQTGVDAYLEAGRAVEIRCEFSIVRPRSHYGTGKNERFLKPSAPVYPTAKPDLSNLIKLVEDALTKVLWADDDQVIRISGVKHYVPWWKAPQSLIEIEVVE